MGIFNSIISDVKLALSNDSNLSYIDFVSAYPSSVNPNPIKKVYVVIGLASIDVLENSLSGYSGIYNGNEFYSKSSNITLSFNIYSPRIMGGEKCIEVFSDICSRIICGEHDYHITNLSCKDTKYDKIRDCYTLPCTAKINAVIGNEVTESDLGTIIVKGVI